MFKFQMFKSMCKLKFVAAFTVVAFGVPGIANASLVYDASILASAQGFGVAPRLLTLSSANNNTTESGVSGFVGTTFTLGGTPISSAFVHDSNGITNLTGTGDMPTPLTDSQKYGFATAGALGITSANQIGILFNATEPGGDEANVTDVTLVFWSSTGTFLGAIDGQNDFLSSNPGNGVAGFTFVVSSDEQAYVNGLLATGGAGTRFTLESTITNATGGPDTYLVYNLNSPGVTVPEPASLLLMGIGLTAIGLMRRKHAKG